MSEEIYITNKKNLLAWSVLSLSLIAGAIIATWYFTKKSLTSADSSPSNGQNNLALTLAPKSSAQTSGQTKGNASSSEAVSLVLRAGWNLVGIPYVLSPNDGKTVLLGLSEQKAYYMEQGGWKNLFDGGTITPGSAYWIHSKSGEVVKLVANATLLDSSKPFIIKLKKGWNAIANPFEKEIVWDPVVRAKNGSTTLEKAINAKVLSRPFKVDPVGGKYIEIASGEKIQPFTGMLIRSGGEVDLIVNAK